MSSIATDNQEPPSRPMKRNRPESNNDPDDNASASVSAPGSCSSPSSFWQVSKRFKSGVVSQMKGVMKNATSLLKVGKSSADKEEVQQTLLPSRLINSEGCQVQTLTVSDQHATLLLTTTTPQKQINGHNGHNGQNGQDEKDGDKKGEKKSILKLTLVPFFRDILGSNPVLEPNDTSGVRPELKLLENNPEASKDILSFLQTYNFYIKSESGAEYSYYDAIPSSYNLTKHSSKPKQESKGNDVDGNGGNHGGKVAVATNKSKVPGSFNVELISPASERQIKRVMPSHSTVLIEESPEMYAQVVQPYIQTIVESGSLNWIFNIIQGKKEQERLLVNNDSFIINIDTKWRSHPDAFKTPREEWYQHKAVEDLYCLGITKVKSIASMRDLTQDHIPMLEEMKREGLNVIEKVYGVPKDQIRVFVHYHPQFYHFHVHFTRLYNEVGSTVERGHLVSDIVQNLRMDSDFYSKRTITYKMKVSSPLYLLLQQRKQESENGQK